MKIVVKFVCLAIFLVVLTLPLTAFDDSKLVLSYRQDETFVSTLTTELNDGINLLDSRSSTQNVIKRPSNDIEGDKLVLGGAFTLLKGETLEGNLFIVGGAAVLEEESVVEKDVIVVGGSLSAKGRIEGDVAVVGGLVTLNEGAEVVGDVNSLAGKLSQDEGARVLGKVNTNVPGMFSFVIPGRIQIPNLGEWAPINLGNMRIPRFDVALNPFWDSLWLLLRSFLWAAIAVLVVLFLPKNSGRAADAAVSQPLIAGGLGCITLIVAPLILLLLAITICGIPISVIGAIVLFVAWSFGIIILGTEVGKRLARLVNRDWAMPVSASIGTFILTFVINSIRTFIPCIGWLAPVLVGIVGLGAVLLTRFGSQDYSPGIQPQPEKPDELNLPNMNALPPTMQEGDGSVSKESPKARKKISPKIN